MPHRPRPTSAEAFANVCLVKRSHVALAAGLLLLTTPALAGCWNGPRATTTMQATMNSGNGVQAQAGSIKIENATLVQGPEGSSSATLLVRLVNTGATPDALVYATINGVPVEIAPESSELAPGASVSFGYESENWLNSYDLDVPTSTYVPVELGFAEAGMASMSVLTVPPVGYYAGIAPNPPAPAA